MLESCAGLPYPETVTQKFSSEVRKVIPLTRPFPETPTDPSAPVGVVRGGGCPSPGGLARPLGADLQDGLGASWIDRLAGLGGDDARALLDALDDRAAARAEGLRRTELQLLHERALREALAEEQLRLQEQLAELEERIAARDAEMLLALARDAEDAARAAILKIISERRRSTRLRAAIAPLERALRRLDALVSRREARLRGLRASSFVPPPEDLPQAAAPRTQTRGLV